MNKTNFEKLKRVLGLLGSEHAGERASAALAAHRLMQSTGTGWDEVLSPSLAQKPGTPAGPQVRGAEYGHNYLEAAESRIRQLRRENERLEKQVALLKSRLASANDKLAQRAETTDEPV